MQQIERFLGKVLQKFSLGEGEKLMTDIHLRANQDTGDLFAFDDMEVEITRCVVDSWIENKSEDFYDDAAKTLRKAIKAKAKQVEKLSIMKPFSFVLENEEGEHIAELYVCDDDLAILDIDEIKGLDNDLDDFLENLMKN